MRNLSKSEALKIHSLKAISKLCKKESNVIAEKTVDRLKAVGLGIGDTITNRYGTYKITSYRFSSFTCKNESKANLGVSLLGVKRLADGTYGTREHNISGWID